MDKIDLLNHRREQDIDTIKSFINDDVMNSLLTVQINVTELCNRKCVFCPRVDANKYPNRNLNITHNIIEKIAIDLKDIHFKGKLSFAGFGEPYLHKSIIELFAIIKQILPNISISVNTNGDHLTTDIIKKSYDNGLDFIYVSLYDGPHQIQHFENMFALAEAKNYMLREHWPSNDSTYNLILNNRGGTIENDIVGYIDSPLKKKCYFPFSKAMIDYNGDLLVCPQDWNREYVIGSLLEHSIKELWLGERMRDIRYKLMCADRTTSPCNKCNAEGTLTGEYGYNLLVKYYDKN